MIDHGVTPGDRASYLTSLPYQLSLAALQPGIGPDLATGILPPSIQAFLARVKIVADETLLADYPLHWSARVVVETPSRRYERLINCIPGDPERPFAEADVQEKFKRFTASVLGGAAEKFLRQSLTALHSTESLSLLMRDIDSLTANAMS